MNVSRPSEHTTYPIQGPKNVLLYLAHVTEHRSVIKKAESSLVWVTEIFFGNKVGILFESRSDELVEHLVVQTIVGRKPKPKPQPSSDLFFRGGVMAYSITSTITITNIIIFLLLFRM